MSALPRATLHLRILGESCRVSVEVPPTPADVGDLLPAARALTNAAMEVATRKSAEAGSPASCRKGCDACCYQLVGITAPEARALARLVEAMPPERQLEIRGRFARTMDAVRESGVMEVETSALDVDAESQKSRSADHLKMAEGYYQLRRPCPFLEGGACTIYEDRPLVCRQYMVTSPAEHCGRLALESITMLEPPLRVSKGLAKITEMLEGKPAEEIPLFAALAWAGMEENASPGPRYSGADLLKLLAKWVDTKSNVPLEERGAEGPYPR